MALVLAWSWRYRRLTVDSFDSLEEAVSCMGYAMDEGLLVFDSIECWTDDGSYETVDYNKFHDLYMRHLKALEENRKPVPPAVGRVFILTADGKEVHWSDYSSQERLQENVADFRKYIGNRVVVKPPRT